MIRRQPIGCVLLLHSWYALKGALGEVDEKIQAEDDRGR
jgi:hypothetical protein